MQALEAWHWPGNIRELRNVIERAVALGNGPVIQFSDLPDAVRTGCPLVAPPAATSAPHRLVPRDSLGGADDEFQRICAALRKHRNNRRRAAAELGISRVAFYKKLNKYGIEKKIKMA